MSVGTPAVVVDAMFTGNNCFATADWRARHSSVRLRRVARSSGLGVELASEASHL